MSQNGKKIKKYRKINIYDKTLTTHEIKKRIRNREAKILLNNLLISSNNLPATKITQA